MVNNRIIDGRLVNQYSIDRNERGDFRAADNDVTFMAYLHLNPALYAIGFNTVEFPQDGRIIYQFGEVAPMIRIRTNNRINSKERNYALRIAAHPAGLVRPIARRVSYPAAIREVRECRALRPDCTFLYVPAGGEGYNVVELERAK